MKFTWKTDVDCSEYTCKPRKGWVIEIVELDEISEWSWIIYNGGMAVAGGSRDALDEAMWEAQGKYLELINTEQ